MKSTPELNKSNNHYRHILQTSYKRMFYVSKIQYSVAISVMDVQKRIITVLLLLVKPKATLMPLLLASKIIPTHPTLSLIVELKKAQTFALNRTKSLNFRFAWEHAGRDSFSISHQESIQQERFFLMTPRRALMGTSTIRTNLATRNRKLCDSLMCRSVCIRASDVCLCCCV